MSKFDMAGEGAPGIKVKEHTLAADTHDAREHRLDANYPITKFNLEKIEAIEGVDSIHREGKYCLQIRVGSMFEVKLVVDRIEALLKDMELPVPAKDGEGEKEQKPNKRRRVSEPPEPVPGSNPFDDAFDIPAGNPSAPWTQPGTGGNHPWHPWRGGGIVDPNSRMRWDAGGLVPGMASQQEIEEARLNLRRVLGDSNADRLIREQRPLLNADLSAIDAAAQILMDRDRRDGEQIGNGGT